MSAAGSVSVQITADVASFQRAIDQAERDVSKFAGSAGRSAAEVEGAMRRTGVSMSGLRFDAQGRLRNEMGQYATAAERARFATERLGASANDNFRRMATGATAAHNAINGLQAGAMRLAAALGGLAAARSIGGGFVAMTDEATRLDGRLRLVTQSSEELARVNRDLFDISQRTRSEFAGNVELYTRSAQALREMGASSQQILTLTEALNQAFVISGATTAEQSSAIIQLSQAFASGVLRGEEFNSVSEQGPRIMQALADALGKTRGELRKLAEDGQLTSDVVFRALLSQAPKLAEEFGKVPRTVSQAMVQLRNDMLSAVAGVNQTEGATAALVAEIDRLRSAVSDTNFASGMTLAVREIATATEQIREAAADVARLYDVVGTAYAQVGETITGFINQVTLSQTAAGDLSDAWFGAMRDLREHVGGAVLDAVERLSAIPSAGVAAYETFVDAWRNLPGALGGIVVEAAAQTIASVEGMVDGVIEILNRIPGVEIESIAGSISARFRAALVPGGEQAGDDFVQKFWSKFDENQNAVRERASAFGQTVAEELGFRSREAQQIVDGYNLIKHWAGQAVEAVRGYFAGSGEVAVAATGPTIALGEATEDTAKSLKKLTSEADRLVERHFPFEAATAEAQRLLAAVNDNTNGLTDMQRAALRLEADDVFRRLEDGAGKTSAALREMQSAASSAVDRFFPFEAAAREAERLNAIIADTTNGLTDLDRRALQLQIDQGFIDAAEAAESLRGKGTKAAEDIGQSFIENVGDVFADIFGQATRDGESFFASILRGFAGLGSQLAAAGGRNLLGRLFGTTALTPAGSQSAAGIGGLIGQGASFAGSSGSGAGVSYGYAAASAPLGALNDNLSKTSRSALDVARQFEGLNERADTGVLDTFLQASGNWKGLSAKDTAWCAAFANAALMQAGGQGTGSNLASSFMDWGQGTNAPKVGDVVVLRPQSRGASGHVGFVAGFGDGTVQIFGGNQSNAANTRSYSTREVVGYRTGAGTGAAANQNLPSSIFSASSQEYARLTERAVGRGVASALPPIDGGYTGYNSTGQIPTPTARPGLFGQGFGQTAMGVVGAGLGIAAQGFQSGNPLMGALGGAMGGFQAGSALFPALGMAGPIGAGLGALVGIGSAIFGARQQRKQEHQQKAQAWEQLRPQYEAFDASLTDKGVGGLRTYLTEQWGKLSEFMKVGGAAWKMGSGNSTAQFQSTGTKLFDGFNKMLQEFRDGYESLVQDLASGEGLQGAFARGRAATRDLKKQLQATRDDIDIAFGNVADIAFMGSPEAIRQAQETEGARANAIERYNRAAGEYALSLMYTAATVSDVQKTIDGFKGTAAGLHDVFADLGWSADEAAKAIHDRLDQAIANIARGLETSVEDQINGLSGLGYLTDARNFLKEFDTLKSDMAASGADTSRLPELFRLQAQAIVDGAELTGTAFTDLIAQFPALAGVVREFTETAVAASAIEIRDAIKGYQERLFQAQNAGNEIALFDRRAAQERIDAARFGADALAALEAALAAERLNIGEQMQTAYRSFLDSRLSEATSARAEAESALRQEYERTVDRIRGIADFLKGIALDDNTSILSGQEQFEEAQRLYRETLFKANGGDREAQEALLGVGQDYLNEAKAYYATSERYGEVYREIEATLKASSAKMETELDVARRQASFLAEIADGTKGLGGLLKEYLEAVQKQLDTQKLVDGNRYFGINPERNRLIDAGFRQSGLTYTGNYGIQADGSNPLDVWFKSLSPAQQAIANGVIHQYIGINRANGGAVWGAGTSTSDSIRANLSNGEYVVREAAASSIGYANMDVLNRTGRLPEVAMPAPFRPAGNDNGGGGQAGLLAAVNGLREEIRLLREDTRASGREVKGAVEDGNRKTGELAAPLKRVASRL